MDSPVFNSYLKPIKKSKNNDNRKLILNYKHFNKLNAVKKCNYKFI